MRFFNRFAGVLLSVCAVAFAASCEKTPEEEDKDNNGKETQTDPGKTETPAPVI